MSKSWFYTKSGRPPVAATEDQLRALLAVGEVQGSDLLWSEGMAGWQPAAEFPELYPVKVVALAVKYCEKCGSPSDLQTRFCDKCGFSFAAPAIPVPPIPAEMIVNRRKFSFGNRRTIFALVLASVAATLGGAWIFLLGTDYYTRIPVAVHRSLNVAISNAFAEARKERRGTYYPVALWKETKLGRGVVLAGLQRNDPVHGDCQEYVVSFITDEKQPVIADFAQVACKQKADRAYTVHPEIPLVIDDARRQRARSLLPSAEPVAGGRWTIVNGKQPCANSRTAAIAMALTRPAPAITTWKSMNNRGALYVYDSVDSRSCQRIIAKTVPPPADGRQFAAEFCPYAEGPVVGWQRTKTSRPSAAEISLVEPLLDQVIGAIR